MQSLGEVQQVAQKIEGVVSVNPDEALHKLLRGLFADDAELVAEAFKRLET